MALYLGTNMNKQKIMLNNKAYLLHIPLAKYITNGIKLLSSDNYILKDSNGLYLTTKKEGD